MNNTDKKAYITKSLGKLIIEMKNMGFSSYAEFWLAILTIFPPESDEEIQGFFENLIEELKEAKKRKNGLDGLN